MSDYQAVYDAVRSRMGHVDLSRLVDAIAGQFDFSHQKAIICQEACLAFGIISDEITRPSVLMRPEIQSETISGFTRWVAIYGHVRGEGNNPEQACKDFDKRWKEKS